MKKNLLFIISMLCVSIGTWADGGNIDGTTSTWDKTDGVLTLTINGQNHLSGHWNAVTSLDGVNRVKVITGSGVTLTGGVWNSSLAMINGRYYSVPILDLSGADVEVITEGGVPYLKMITDWTSNQEFKNIILPSSLASYLTTLKISQVTRTVPEAIGNSNLYLISGTTVNAVYKNTTSMPSLDTFGSTMRTLKPATDIAGAISFTSVITDAMVTAGKDAGTPYYYTIDLSNVTTAAAGDAPDYTNKITVSAGTKVNCLSGDVKNRVTGTDDENIAFVDPNIVCTAENLATEVSELTAKGVAAQSVTLTGEITSGVMTTLNSLTSLVRINLQEATLATGVELNSLAIPSTLEVLVLPKKASDTKSSVTDAMKTHANLKYIYAPFSGTRDKDQTVADYVWVNKPGGLSKAFDDQAGLLSAWYMIVESTVALNDDDVNFWGSDPEHARSMQYRYLDLSGANITPAVLANYKVTDELPYRIILPNDWTGDMMAVFAANPKKGSIAAVYSYTGTDHKRLDILELNDYAYLPTALNDSRIVRSGTTSIRVVSGHYGSNPVYSKFGDNLLTAINGAASSITSVTIAVGSGIYESVDTNSDDKDDTDLTITGTKTFEFTNTNLTDLTLSFLNNEYVTFDIHGCSKLQNLTANETKLKSIVANGITTLTKVDMGHAIIGGDVNYSGCTALASLEPGKDEIGGTLNISNTAITTLDLSDVTVMSVDASNNSSLTTLNLKGITLSGMGSTPDEILQANIDGRIGTVEITRSGGDYSNIDIEVGEEDDFDRNRIVPNPTASADGYNNCVNDYNTAHATWETNFGNWLYDNKATYLSSVLEAQLRSDYNDLDSDDKAEYGNSADNYVKYRMMQGDLGVGTIPNAAFTNWLYTNRTSYLSTTKEDELNTDYTTNWTGTYATFEKYLKSGYLVNNIDLDGSGSGNTVDNETAVAAATAAYTGEWTTDPYVMLENAKTAFASSGAEGAGAEPVEDCTSTSYDLVTTPDAHVEITAEGNDLATHIGEYTYMDGETSLSVPTAPQIEILHVTGTLTSADITYIASMTGLKCLDLSGATYDSGLTFQNVLDAGLRITTAIILPKTGSSTTESGIEADMLAAMYAFQRANYECVGYYSKKESEDKNLNIYGYNSTVANLKTGNLSTQQGETQAKLIDNYTDIKFLRYYKDGEDITKTFDNGQDFPQATPSLLPALGTITADSNYPFTVDMTWLNISNLGNDFHNVDCRYLVIPQNSSAATVTRNDKLYNNDFTVEDDGNGNTNDYTYNDRVYAVSTYKGNVAPYATNAYFGGDPLWYDNGFGHKNTTANLTYLRAAGAGHLAEVSSHMSELLKGAHIISIAGTIDNNEINGLNALTNPCIDLTRATIASNSVLESLDNDYVESISIPYYSVTSLEAIPANDVKGLSDLPTLSKTACTNLKGVGMLVKSNDIASGSSKKGRLIYKSYEEGGMANQMLMLHALNQVNREYVISRMVLGGPVNARDISVRDNGIDMNGHLATIVTDGKMTAEATTFWDAENGNQIYGTLNGYTNIEWWDFSKVTLPTYTSVGAQGYKKIPNSSDWEFDEDVDYAFDNDTHRYAAAKASGSSYSYQNDLCYTELGLAPSTLLMDEPKLPTDESVWRLVDNALNNCHLLYNICLPWNYQYLGNGAMYGTFLQHITTTDAVGNLIDHGDHTYTLSANLKELGNKPTGEKEFVSVLVFPHDRPVYDCYALATTTPKCYRGVFAANMYYGWGGFKDASFPYCREKYQNGSNWFCVLRYPYKAAWEADHPSLSPARQTDMEFEEDDDEPMAGVQKAPASRRTQKGQVDPDASYEEMKMAYTDVTKNYTKKEQTGAVDANGDAILWPTFSELRRAYNQASNNVTWNNWKATYDINHDVPEGSGTIPLDAETVTSLGNSDHNTKTGTDSGAANTDGDPYLFEDYEGWHQFVLSQATYVKPGEKQVPIDYREYEKDASWYTFCIPFDMTEEDVIKLMGVPASTDKVKTTTSTFGDHPEEESSKYQTTALLPEIRTMKSVTRTPSTTTVNIYTSKDLATDEAKKFYKPAYGETPEEYESNGTVTIDGSTKDVMIRGGYPYLIKPWKLRGTTISSLGKDIMTRYQFRAEQSSIYHSTADCYDSFGSGDNKTGTFARPYENHKMQATEDSEAGGAMKHTDTNHENKPYNYTYVGQFWKQRLPLHCFYQNSKRLWRHYQNYDERYFWNPYTCIIMVTDEVKSEAEKAANPAVTLKGGEFRDELNCKYPESTGKDKQGGEVFDKALEVYYKNGLDDPFDTASARDYQFFFDEDIMDFDPDGQATAIEVLDGVRVAPIRGKVYNMAGQYVGNSLEGLSKGMYIVNGKKYVIN